MSQKMEKRIRREVRKKRKALTIEIMRQIYRLPFKERLRIAFRIITRK